MITFPILYVTSDINFMIQIYCFISRIRCIPYSFLTSCEFCRLLITFANSLDPDQNRQNVGPDLDPNVWHFDSVPERIFEKVYFEKYQKQHVQLSSEASFGLSLHLPSYLIFKAAKAMVKLQASLILDCLLLG